MTNAQAMIAPVPDDPSGHRETNPRPILLIDDLHTWFPTANGTVRAVDGVSLSVDRGRTLGIVGESGSGKSVLCRTIMNLLPRSAIVPDETTISFEDRDVRRLTKVEAKHFWGVEMAMVFQDPMTSLNPVMKIGRQITGPLQFHLGLGRTDARRRALQLLEQVGVPAAQHRIDQYPHELSGGMRQRVTIARALSCEPKLLIADEPTTALDVTVQRQILDLLGDLQRQRAMTMVIVTHDLGVVAGRTDDVAVMYAGQVVERASTSALFRRPRHPYTKALLDSIPRMRDPSHTRLQAISGRPPVITTERTGCEFAPRCRHAQERCIVENPTLGPGDEPGHTFRCFYPIGTAAGDDALRRNHELGHTVTGLAVAGGAA